MSPTKISRNRSSALYFSGRRLLCHSTQRFVRFEGISVPGLCIELREYRIEDPEVSNVGSSNDDMTMILSRWGDTKMANSLQLHRTGSDGSFAFVAPESNMPRNLYLGFYSQGGDYPTVVRSCSGHSNQGRKGQMVNKSFSVWRASGRVELNIDLADELEAAELLWDSPARENDHSPCAWREGRTTAVDVPVVRQPQGMEAPALDGARSPLEGLGGRPDLWEPHPQKSRRQGITDPQDSGMVMPLQSACWNYGQSDAGLWQEDVALCTLLRRPYSDETFRRTIINRSLETGWKTIASLLQEPKEAERWWMVQATIGVVGIGYCLFVLSRKAAEGNNLKETRGVFTQRGQSSRLQDRSLRSGRGLRAHHDEDVTISPPMHERNHTNETSKGTNEQIDEGDKDMFPLVFRALSHHVDEFQDSRGVGGSTCGSNFILTKGQC